MIPPIGLLAALKYYSQGHVNIAVAIFVAIGFFVGGYIGAAIVTHIPDVALRRIFGVFLLLLSIKMMLGK